MRGINASIVDEEGAVGLGGHEAKALEMRRKPVKPRLWRLLESIQGLAQEADIIGMSFVDEAGGLLIVHCLREIAVEKGVLDVELVNWPVASSCQVQDGADGRLLYNQRECLVEVEAGALREASDHPASLAALQGAVGIVLVLEDPLATDDIGIAWTRN